MMMSTVVPIVLQEKKEFDRIEKRKAKSRVAANCRRQQETDTFNQIRKEMPVPVKQLDQMDKSTVMRLLISFMKLRSIANTDEFQPRDVMKREVSSEIPSDEEYINALNGFIIVLSHDCDILFVSTNVKQYIGVPCLDLIGQNLFGFTHEGDHAEITNCLKATSEGRETHSFFMRMKSTLTSLRKNVNLKSATYKVLKCEGVVRHSAEPSDVYMVAYCEPIPHPANIEMVLDCNTFLSQHSLDMKFTFCDSDRISSLMGYAEDDMIGESFYNFCHAEDIKELDRAMRKLFRLGQVTTRQYRMLAKFGGYVWVISQATVINNPRNQQPSYVVCVNNVISGVINENRILSLAQSKFTGSSQSAVIKQEIDDLPYEELESLDSTDSIFCDSTSKIFRDIELDDQADFQFADDATSKVLVPCTESMKVMAKNAPSIGDQIDFSQFADVFGVDLFDNAPSIGDPHCSANVMPAPQEENKNMTPNMSVNVDRVKGYLKEEYANCRYGGPQMVPPTYQPTRVPMNGLLNDDRTSPQYPLTCNTPPPYPLTCNTSPPYPLTPTTPPEMMIYPKRKIPRGNFQVVAVPKNQYQRHIQHQGGTSGIMYKTNPPEIDDPPLKRLKRQSIFDRETEEWQERPYLDTRSSPQTSELLLNGNYTCGDDSSLTSFLLKPGDKYDNFDAPMERQEPSRDRDPSWSCASNARCSSLLPVISLHDCEVNAPVDKKLSTVDWMTLSSALGI